MEFKGFGVWVYYQRGVRADIIAIENKHGGKMTTSTTSTSSGFGLPTVLFVVFLVLKLTEVIAWSWWWVTAPLWIPVVMFLVALIAFGVVAFVGAGIATLVNKIWK